MNVQVGDDNIVVPDGTSPENVDRLVRMHLIRTGHKKANVGADLTREAAQDEVSAKNPDMSTRFATGTRTRMKEIAAAGKKLYRDLSPDEQGDLDAARATRRAAGTAANIGSGALDAAVMALPLSRAAQIGSVPLRIAASAGTGAAGGALLNPEDRGKHALIGGASAAIPTALGASRLGGATMADATRIMRDARNSPFLKGLLGQASGVGIGAGLLGGIPSSSIPIAGGVLGGAGGLWGLARAASARPGVMEGLGFGTAEEFDRELEGH